MLVRTYVVLMPTSSPTTPLDILVQNAPGTQAAPIKVADAAYYELQGRPFRIPQLATVGTAGGFSPPLRLGFSVVVTKISSTDVVELPGVQLSASLISLSSTDAGPTISVPSFPDPAGGPSVRLIGAVGTAGAIFGVTLFVAEPKDVDRSGTAI